MIENDKFFNLWSRKLLFNEAQLNKAGKKYIGKIYNINWLFFFFVLRVRNEKSRRFRKREKILFLKRYQNSREDNIIRQG